MDCRVFGYKGPDYPDDTCTTRQEQYGTSSTHLVIGEQPDIFIHKQPVGFPLTHFMPRLNRDQFDRFIQWSFTPVYHRDAPAVAGPARESRLFPGSFTKDKEQVPQGHDTWLYPPMPLCTEMLTGKVAFDTMRPRWHVLVRVGTDESPRIGARGPFIEGRKMRSSENVNQD